MSATTDCVLVSPAEVLLEDGLRRVGISQFGVVRAIGVPKSFINVN